MINHKLPPRPRWNFTDVKTAAAAEIIDAVREWATSASVEDVNGDHRQFKALVTLAILESADAYWAAQYLHSFYEWPVDNNLVMIIQSAYRRMEPMTVPFVHAWVMQNGVRLEAREGDRVKFRVGTVDLVGRVVACVPREARMIVSVGVKKPVNMPVNAEDFVEVMSKPSQNNSPLEPRPIGVA